MNWFVSRFCCRFGYWLCCGGVWITLKSFYCKPICFECGNLISAKIGTYLLICISCKRQYEPLRRGIEE